MMIKIALITLFGLLVTTNFSQEYYNSNFTFYQSETNPSSIASSKISKVVKSSFLYSSDYNQQSISSSIYFPKQFLGVGINVNNTQVEQHNYKKIGLSVAYRNVLFGKIKTRIGGQYKIIQNKSSSGVYSLYSFEEKNTTNKNDKLNNANISISFTDLANRYYLIGGKLNFNLFGNSQEYFKTYNYLTIGNLINRYNYSFRAQVSYSIIQTNSLLGKNTNHVVTIANQISISRKTILLISGKLGYWNNSIYQFKPGIAFYKHFSNKDPFNSYARFSAKDSGILIKLALDIGVNKFNQKLEYPPVLEIIIQLKF